MSDDIVKRLRERPWRGAAESNDQAALRRQKERDAGADFIETLSAKCDVLEERVTELEGLLSETLHELASRLDYAYPERDLYPREMQNYKDGMEIVQRMYAALERNQHE
jgi:hypothetical protein